MLLLLILKVMVILQIVLLEFAQIELVILMALMMDYLLMIMMGSTNSISTGVDPSCNSI
jgi:hypothetical protein